MAAAGRRASPTTRTTTCTSAQAARTPACASAWRVRARQARHAKSGSSALVAGAVSPASATSAVSAARERRRPPAGGSSSSNAAASTSQGWLFTVFSQISSVTTPASTRTMPTARRARPPQNGARLQAITATGTSCATSANSTVTWGACTSGSTPPRASRAATVVARFAHSSRYPAGR